MTGVGWGGGTPTRWRAPLLAVIGRGCTRRRSRRPLLAVIRRDVGGQRGWVATGGVGRARGGWLGDDGFDEVGAGFGEGLAQLGGEFRRGRGPGGRDAHSGGQGREAERRPGQVEQVAGGVP